jgi:hypothetical protein
MSYCSTKTYGYFLLELLLLQKKGVYVSSFDFKAKPSYQIQAAGDI